MDRRLADCQRAHVDDQCAQARQLDRLDRPGALHRGRLLRGLQPRPRRRHDRREHGSDGRCAAQHEGQRPRSQPELRGQPDGADQRRRGVHRYSHPVHRRRTNAQSDAERVATRVLDHLRRLPGDELDIRSVCRRRGAVLERSGLPEEREERQEGEEGQGEH